MEAKVLYTCAGCGKGIAPCSGDPVVSSNTLGWGNRYHWECARKRYVELKRANAQHQHEVTQRRSLALMNVAAERRERRHREAVVEAAATLFGTMPDEDAVGDALDSLFDEEET